GSSASLFVGGQFTHAGSIGAIHVARWDGTTWDNLGGNGMNSEVTALTIQNAKLLAGGSFTAAGRAQAGSVATWDGSAWTALGSAPPLCSVAALAVSGSNLYASGGSPSNPVCLWNGSTWSALSGLGSGVGDALAVYGGNLVAGGTFCPSAGDPR